MAKAKERTKKAIVQRLSEVRIVEIACKSVGISRATYYRWLQEDKFFKYDCEDAIRLGTDTISDLAESQVVSKIKAGDFKASAYWLEHHHRDYKPKPKTPKEERELFFEATPEDIAEMERALNALKETLPDNK